MVSFLFLNDDLNASFQAGVDTLYNKCVSLGFTPAGKTPTDIADTIAKIYTDRYNSGRTQGQNDVKANPGAYGIVSKKLRRVVLKVQYAVNRGGSQSHNVTALASYNSSGNITGVSIESGGSNFFGNSNEMRYTINGYEFS